METVVVTGSHIVSNGNNSPTPLTVVNAQQLLATAPASIPDGLNKLPVFTASQTPNNSVNGANGRGMGMPGNFLNMRNMGAIRTLILEDGHRVPGTFYDTTVDVDMLPQMLIQRVEVVTGGASAVYGSDAVAGVVNFIIDHKFDGIRAIAQGGESGYADARSFRVGVANGFDVGSRGHFEWSAEYSDRDAITHRSARPLGNNDSALLGRGTVASPYVLATGLRTSNVAFGGLATSGPFSGQQFLANGQLGPFNPGTPTPTTNDAIGGDGGVQGDEYLLPVLNSGQVFARFDDDITDDVHGYLEARGAMSRTYEANQGFTNVPTGFPIFIYSGNAFLPASAQAQLTAANVSSFSMNRTDNGDLAPRLGLTNHTGAVSASAGLNGETFGDFTWDVNYTHGESRNMLTTTNNVNSARFYAAIDAVVNPATGQTVCKVTLTAPGAFPGCVPYNLFGPNNSSEAAKNYVEGTTSWTAHNGMDAFSANLTGTAFDGWAGPIKVAVGAEYRLASLNVTTSVPNNNFDPTNLRLGQAGNSLPSSYPTSNLAWFKEVQVPAKGSENVSEGNVELDAPLLKELPLIELLSFNGAYRYTAYSTSGLGTKALFSANTWKLGLEWQMFDDLRLRATRSRDIRAPTLWDLYQQQGASSSGITDALTGVTAQGITIRGGNPLLKPEVARNTTAGLVYAPSWLSGFSTSIDYFHIVIDNAIGAVSGTDSAIQGLCNASAGTSPYCNLVVRPISYNSTAAANFPTLVYNFGENLAVNYAEGVDVEVNYATDLNNISSNLDGNLDLRLLWTHQPTIKTQAEPGAVITNAAGGVDNITSHNAVPADKVTFQLGYRLDALGISVLERYYGSEHWGVNPSLVYNVPTSIKPYYQTDVNFSYDFTSMDQPLTAFLNINNLFDAQGQDIGGYGGSIGEIYPVASYADVIGRYFTVGVRLNM